MSYIRKIRQRTQRRAQRVRAALSCSKPRVSIFRSLKHLQGQIIDDNKQVTLASITTAVMQEVAGTKTERSFAAGQALAQKAVNMGIVDVQLDRGSYRYHGRVKAFAEGLRAGGMQF